MRPQPGFLVSSVSGTIGSRLLGRGGGQSVATCPDVVYFHGDSWWRKSLGFLASGFIIVRNHLRVAYQGLPESAGRL